MEDRYGRTIEYMRVSVTDRCNLRCVYCMPEKGIETVRHGDILSYDEIERVCRIGTELGITKIKLTGGEPLVRKNLPALVEKLKQIPDMDQVTLTTNGILLSSQISALVSAGLDGVNISLDTLDPERYRDITRRGRLEDVLAGIEKALSFSGLSVKINCVPLADIPGSEYVRLAELARDRQISVRFIEMMPIGLGKQFPGRSGDEMTQILQTAFGPAQSYDEKLGNGPAVYMTFQDFRGTVGLIRAMSHQFCRTCNRIRLTSEGFLKPCLQYGGGKDLRNLLRNGADDSQLKIAMQETVYGKPECHHFGICEGKAGQKDAGGGSEEKEMFRIGG